MNEINPLGSPNNASERRITYCWIRQLRWYYLQVHLRPNVVLNRGKYKLQCQRLCFVLTSLLRGFESDLVLVRSSKMSLKVEKHDFFFFFHFLFGYCLGFNLVKNPHWLSNWFQRYKQLKDWTNIKKQRKLSALFICIFASSIGLILLDHITFWCPNKLRIRCIFRSLHMQLDIQDGGYLCTSIYCWFQKNKVLANIKQQLAQRTTPKYKSVHLNSLTKHDYVFKKKGKRFPTDRPSWFFCPGRATQHFVFA